MKNRAFLYAVLSKFYGLLDLLYFTDNDRNPRKLILNKIPQSKSKVLEIAVGTAANSRLLAKYRHEAEIIGIDISEPMLRVARKIIQKQAITTIRLLQMDATDLTFDKDSFDVIVISLLLHELNEDVANSILKESKRVLKPDGKMFILEWDKPKKIFQKAQFFFMELLEPKTYRGLLKTI